MIETGLATYLNTMYDEWKQNREDLEKKWQRNLRAIKGIDNEVWKDGEAEKWRSKTYIKLIKAKVFIAYCIIIDVYLQGGMVPFALSHGPFEEKQAEGQDGMAVDQDILDMTDMIREQLTDRRADKEYMKKILSLAYYGEGYSKYNIKDVETSMYIPGDGLDDEGNPVEMPEYPEYRSTVKMVPGHEYRSVWTIVSDPEDGDLQKNRGTFEKDLASPFDIRQKENGKFYIKEAIDEAISEYIKADAVKDQETLRPGLREIKYRKKSIDNKEFWGRAPRNLVDAFERDVLGKETSTVMNPDWQDDIGDEVEILAELAGDTIIRFVKRNIGDKRPYKKCLWEESLDEDHGVSIADNMEAIEIANNGMQRAFEDNKKLSGNVITATKKRFLSPEFDGKLRPGTNIEVSESCDDARKAIAPIVIPDVGESLLSGISLMEKWGDVVSQVPTIAQGFSLAKHKPDTLGEVQMMMENLGKYFGMVIRNIDESFTEQEICDLYDYNMRDPNYTGKKSNMKVNATGFSSFQNKIVVVQKLRELLAAALQDQSGLILREIKIRPHLEEIYKNIDVDVDKFLKSEVEKKKELDDARAQQEAAQQAESQQAEALAAKEKQDKEEDFQRDLLKEQVKAATA